MPKTKAVSAPEPPVQQVTQNVVSTDALAEALVKAINLAKPKEKKTAANRVPNTPWTPKDGSPKLKLKRRVHQHGLLLDPDFLTNEQIALFNKLRPGLFLDGHVRVTRRKDRGVDISYPVKTAAQRLRLVNQFGIRSIDELLQRCITEAENPQKDPVDADGDYI